VAGKLTAGAVELFHVQTLSTGHGNPAGCSAAHSNCAHSPMTFTVRASRHTLRRCSSVSTASARNAVASSSPCSRLYRNACTPRFSRLSWCLRFALLMSARAQVLHVRNP